MNSLKFAGFVLALLLASVASADDRDSRGRNDRDSWRDRGDRYDNYDRYDRNRSNVSVNFVIGTPVNRWSPHGLRNNNRGRNNWNDNWYNNNRYINNYYNNAYRPFGGNTFVFNSSLGYLPTSLVNYVSPPTVVYKTQYVRSSSQTVYRDEGNYYSAGTSLLRDRNGYCYERETDRQGREIRRRVADHRCNF